MRNILNLISLIIVTTVITMTSCILLPELVPSMLIVGLIALAVMYTMLVFMCREYKAKYQRNRKHWESLHNSLQDTIIGKDKAIIIKDKDLKGFEERYRIAIIMRNASERNCGVMIEMISDLVNEIEEGKEMIADLTNNKQSKQTK